MWHRTRSVRRNLSLGSLLVVAGLWLVPASPAAADYPYGGRGEVAELGRRLHDFHYRGRHGDKSPNYSNSSIRYKGRPGHHVYHSDYRRPSRRPYYSLGHGFHRPVHACATPTIQPIYIVQQVPAPPPRPVTRADIEMVPIRVVKREPKQKAMIERVTLADGTVRTIITSVPLSGSSEPTPPETAVAEGVDPDATDGS